MTDHTRDPIVAGVDVGTTHTKVALHHATDGRLMASARVRTPSDVDGIRAAVLATLRQCVSAAAVTPQAVGVTGMAETGAALDHDLQPASELLSWQDPRGAHEATELRAQIGDLALFERTGLHLTAKLPIAKWRWLRNESAQSLRRMRVWAGVPELAFASLTAQVVTDATLAGRTGAFDIVAGGYVDEFATLAGVNVEQLPQVVAAGEVAGRVSKAAAGLTGLAAGTPVVVAGHDHLVAAYAAGIRSNGQVADSMGTAEAVVTLTSRPHLRSDVLAAGTSVGRFIDGKHFCLVSGLPSCGALIDWFRDLAGIGRDDESLRAQLDALDPGPTGVVVLPYLGGRAAPAPDPSQGLAICGITTGNSLAQLVRALMDGTSLHARWMIEAHEGITKTGTGQLIVLGGATQSSSWMRAKAAITPGHMQVCDIAETAAAGAAFLAGRAVGIVPADLMLPTQPVHATPEQRARWEQWYHTEFLPRAKSSPHATNEERTSA